MVFVSRCISDLRDKPNNFGIDNNADNMTGNIENYSEWGMVRMTSSGFPGLRYFNLSVNLPFTETVWQIQNAILFNQAPLGEIQSINFFFDIGARGKIFDLQKELDNKQDVEMFVWWFKIDTATGDTSTGSHIVNVTNVKKMGNGKYQITAQDDRKQGEAGGTESESVTYDSATNKFTSGSYVGYNMGIYEFVVECPNDLTTQQVSPPNGAGGVTPGSPLVWNDVAGASSFWLEVSTDPLFATHVINQTSVPDSFYFPPPGVLQPLTMYHWRVRVNDSAGPGSYLTIFNFTTSESKILHASALVQGLYSGTMIPDTMGIELRHTFPPYSLVETAKGILDMNGDGVFDLYNVTDGTPYYLVLDHRNSIITYSNPVVMFAGGIASYSFIPSASQAFGNNMILVDTSPVRYAIYSGDVNKDGVIDATDLSLIDNDAANFKVGYVNTDLNGDEFVDGTDFSIADNNATNFVSAVIP